MASFTITPNSSLHLRVQPPYPSQTTTPFPQQQRLTRGSVRDRGSLVVTRGGAPGASTYLFAFIFPLSLLAVTIFTSVKISDKLDRDFYEEMEVNQAILEAEDEDDVVVAPTQEEPHRSRTRNRPKREAEVSGRQTSCADMASHRDLVETIQSDRILSDIRNIVCGATLLVPGNCFPDCFRGINNVIMAWRLIGTVCITTRFQVTLIYNPSCYTLSITIDCDHLVSPAPPLYHPVDSATTFVSSEWYLLSHSDWAPPSPPSANLFCVNFAFVLLETGGRACVGQNTYKTEEKAPAKQPVEKLNHSSTSSGAYLFIRDEFYSLQSILTEEC
ncbi:hypothetical protein Tco_1294233 [Tanacetum coccineum]